jgi:hypothetical protein
VTDRIDGQRALLPCQSHRFFPLVSEIDRQCMEFHALLALRVTSTLAKLRDRCPKA